LNAREPGKTRDADFSGAAAALVEVAKVALGVDLKGPIAIDEPRSSDGLRDGDGFVFSALQGSPALFLGLILRSGFNENPCVADARELNLILGHIYCLHCRW
jgi:hypothetical protein